MPYNPKSKKNLIYKKKGDKPNPNVGRKPKLPAIEEVLAKVLSQEKNGVSVFEGIVIAMTNKALKGDVQAVRWLTDRGYGLPSQKHELTGANGQPIQSEMKLSINLITSDKPLANSEDEVDITK